MSPFIRQIRSKFSQIGSGAIQLIPSPVSQGIYTIQIDNTSKRNALSPKMMADLADIVDTLEFKLKGSESKSLYGVVFYGHADTFCSGFDLGVAKETFLTSSAGNEFCQLMHDTLLRFRNLPLISVAAIEGYALGGGAELSTMCDFRVMSNNATLRYVQGRMGVVPGWGGTWRINQIVGPQKALKILLEGESLTASAAKDLGLVDSITDAGQAVTGAETWLKNLSKDKEPHVLRAIKSATNELVLRNSDVESLNSQRSIFTSLWGGSANISAVARAGSKTKRAP